MTSLQQQLLVSDLTPACETGDVNAIKEVMDAYFHQLHTARSLFCVTDEKYEKPCLPESRDFLDKGHLHSFLASRRLMAMKNLGEGEDFRYTFTISLDTQFPSFLRSRYQGASIAGQDDALTECLRFLAPYRSGIGMEPYLFENNEQLDDRKVRETIEAYTQFRHSSKESLSEGRIEAALSGSALASDVDATMEMLRGPDWQVIAANAKRNWAISYIILLIAAAIHLTSGRRSAPYRLSRLLEELDGIMVFPKTEIHLVHTFFERGNQERFFRQIQANGSDFTQKLGNMAWDLSCSRTVFQNVSGIARANPDHADFVAPYLLTFDGPLRELLAGFKANALITYLQDGVKSIVIYPMVIETALAEAFKSSQHMLTPERKAARLQRGREFYENESRREECVEHAEGLLNAAISATAAP
jgi:hypothetical protein